ASRAASNPMRMTWRLAAWAISGAAFAAHIAYEQVRLRSSPGPTALHASLAVALGAFALAVAANVHAQAAASHQPSHFLALVLWPVVTALPAFVVGLAAAARHGPCRRDGWREDARGEAAHRAGPVPRPRLRDRALRGPTRRQRWARRGALRPLLVGRVPGDPAHGIGPLGEHPVEARRHPCR